MIKFALPLSLLMAIVALSCSTSNKKIDPPVQQQASGKGHIRISQTNPRYFEYENGVPYIPIGINLINPSGKNHQLPDSAFLEIENWMKRLSENGGNYIRVWLSESFWDIETKAGVYDSEKVARIDRYLGLASKYNLRVKVTLEHFRGITLDENNQRWANKNVYHKSNGGPLDNVGQFLTTAAGKKLFLDKVDFYRARYGADTLFFGWELWNEMNAMSVPADSQFFSWNREMLSAVKERFPENLVMQSLGSFDHESVRPLYKKVMELPGNQVAQVHRYLDLGAAMPVCQESMDIICSSAVEELASYGLNKPVLLAETGAVEPKHAGPSKYYQTDTVGIMLHDILFAPFFAGAAGTGMSWHWDSYVSRNNLWHHFKRFKEAIRGINPVKERFESSVVVTRDVRMYKLKGTRTQLLWLRDKESTWKTELEQHQQPRELSGITLTHEELGFKDPEDILVYDPWTDKWSQVEHKDGYYVLPAFTRSLVVRSEVN